MAQIENLGTLDGAQLQNLLQQNRAEYVEQNENGGHVYKLADGSTLVVYVRSGAYKVTRIIDACAC